MYIYRERERNESNNCHLASTTGTRHYAAHLASSEIVSMLLSLDTAIKLHILKGQSL